MNKKYIVGAGLISIVAIFAFKFLNDLIKMDLEPFDLDLEENLYED